jgi:hypothetical protein
MLKALEPHGICLVLARDLAGSFASSSVGASVHTFASDIEFAYMFARVAAGTPATDDEEMQLRKKLGLYPGSFEANNIDCRLINDAEQIGLLTRES